MTAENKDSKINVSDMLSNYFKGVNLFNLGAIQTQDKDTKAYKTYTVFGCRMKCESADNQLLFALYPGKVSDDMMEYNKSWTSLHFRSFTKMDTLKGIMQLDWDVLKTKEVQSPKIKELKQSLVIEEIEDLRTKGSRTYKLKGEDKINYLFIIESKEQNTTNGNRLKSAYDLDLVISQRENLIIERL